MKVLCFLYAIFFLQGLASGIFFPTLASVWLFVSALVAIVIVTELFGWLGFGDQWHEYRTTVYIVYPVMMLFGLFGIFLGSGKVGTLLVTVGTFISR